MINRNRVQLSKLALGLAIALAAAPAFAQNTSSALGGRISSATGQPVAGAQVTIRHTESGSVSNATTDAEGRYAARGLRPGGPYTITITKDGVTTKREGVYLQLAETTSVDASLGGGAATTLGTVQVTGVNPGISEVFSATTMGSGTVISQQMIDQQPTIDRSIADVVKMDPRIVKIDRETQAISVSGQNPRFNSIKVDGVPTNDNFGLNESGLPSLNQPISGDWISQYNVGISSYDVSQSDFVGANINAVTKSGTNDVQGTVYGVYRDNSMIRKSPSGDKFVGLKSEWTRGAYVGAPLIKDRLFIFAGYEQFQRTGTLPPRGVAGSAATTNLKVTQAQVDAVTASFSRLFGTGVSPGGSPAPFDNTDNKQFLKLDLNINDDHRVAFRYNKTDGQVARFSRTNGQLQLASNVYADNIKFQSYALNFYDDWSENLSSEFNVSKANYDSRPESSSFMPQITIRNIPNTASGETIVFGTERSRQANQLNVETWTSALTFNYFMGDHQFKVGMDYEKNDVYNLFLQDVYGNYTIDYGNFTNPTYTAATLPRAFFNFKRPTPGTPGYTLDDIAATFDVSTIGFLAQDTWTATKNLTLTYGVRVDTNQVGGEITENAKFRSDFGVDNRNTIDGNVTIQPRLGFNYTFDGDLRMQMRGGVGKFLGSAPGVWVSNSYSNTGVGVDSYSVTGGNGVVIDPNGQVVLVPAIGVASRAVAALSNDFKQPTVIKANLAFESELGFGGLVGGAEILLTQVEQGVHFTNIAIGPQSGQLPDLRQSFWTSTAQAGFAQTGSSPGSTIGSNRSNAKCIKVAVGSSTCAYTDAIIMSNTSKGSASNFTVFLEKPWKNNWSAKFGYTLGSAEEDSPANSSVAFSNWNGRFVYNTDEYKASTANYQIKDRFTANASYRWNWLENAPTTVSVYYEGRSGRPFSYAFANDANGDGQANDLFYIPTQPGDVAYTSGSTVQDRDAFNAYIANNQYLATHRGQVAERNGARAPFVNQFDLRFSQKLPFFGDRESEIYLDIQNVGNLLNKKWGQIEEAGFPARVQMARFAGVNSANRYVYDVSSFYSEANNASTTPVLELKDVVGESRWSAQVGFKINF